MLLDNEKIMENMDNILHKETQRQKNHIDLTVTKIFHVIDRGSLDFGGSEYIESNIEELFAEKKSEDDKYGWWHLDHGTYLIEFNEKLIKEFGIIQSLPRLMKTGCFLPMQIVHPSSKMISLLRVGEHGVDIKENARVAGLFSLQS